MLTFHEKNALYNSTFASFWIHLRQKRFALLTELQSLPDAKVKHD